MEKHQNQKIRNATEVTYNGVTFKSKLEQSIYSTLLKEGFNPQYEPFTFTLWSGFTPITPFYDAETVNQMKKRLKGSSSEFHRLLTLKNSRMIDIKYTPDFYFKYKNLRVYIEAKGIENDVFYIKKKMFLKYLDEHFLHSGEKSVFFEVRTKRQLFQAINIIKSLTRDEQQTTIEN